MNPTVFILAIAGVLRLASGLKDDSLRVLDIGEDETITVKEIDKWALKRRGIQFIDVTNHFGLPWNKKSGNSNEVPVYNYPESLTNGDVMQELVSFIEEDELYHNLAKLTSFYTRYYKSEFGFKSAQWLSSKIHDIMDELPIDVYSIEHHDHKDWKQFSIIVKVNGVETAESIIVIGSHHDSMNLIFPSWMASPGADDDGSGTVTVLESLRVYIDLVKKGYQPQNTVEFHFYSAEEGGLLGSFDVFTEYAQQEKRVVAMLQQDMTGYVPDKNDEHVSIVTDYTSPELNEFLKLLIGSYLSIPFKESTCGYACSDHGSATKNGFPASFVLESINGKTNKYIHTTMDTLDRLSLSHMKEHVKLVLGFIVELDNWRFKQIKRKPSMN